MDSIPDTGTSKDIRDLLKSAFIPALPKDSIARQIAEASIWRIGGGASARNHLPPRTTRSIGARTVSPNEGI
jgi:hypothetical protein